MKKSTKIILWVVLGLVLSPILPVILLCILIVIDERVGQTERLNNAYTVTYDSSLQKERNKLLTKQELDNITGINFPGFDVISVDPPGSLQQDPCYIWQLNLKYDFSKDYLEELIKGGKLSYIEEEDSYVYSLPIKKGERFSDLEIVIKGRSVIIYDVFELKDSYTY